MWGTVIWLDISNKRVEGKEHMRLLVGWIKRGNRLGHLMAERMRDKGLMAEMLV
jgi:hypothetical protein